MASVDHNGLIDIIINLTVSIIPPFSIWIINFITTMNFESR